MQLNAFFPSLDIGTDPAKIRDWAQAAEDLGYAYIEVPDHVFGATRGTAGYLSTARRSPSTKPL
jgi:alkanesulfonate monooxygenase SsuD/methylene tetrahydromethanopterin reductase-like flavin-dependent oxidoreductase (luciferase family)